MARHGAVQRLLEVGMVMLLAGCPPGPEADAGRGGAGDGGLSACQGRVGCPCENGACVSGECVRGQCADCVRGEEGCVCRANGACNAALRCTGGMCETCPAGQAGCPCGAQDGCGAGLLCASGVCVADTCTEGAASCPCRGAEPKCDGDQYCDTTSRCQACGNDVVGCPCAAGACIGPAVCDAATSRCREPVSCAMLVTRGTCGTNQVCTESSGADATCVPMACEDGYRWSGTACVACVSLGCTNEPSCAADGGVAAACAAEHRACQELNATVLCGSCLPGFTENGSGQCVPVPTCGGATCTLSQYCDPTGPTPACVGLPCGQGQALDRNYVCRPCSRSCTGDGLSGRLWPFRALDDSCVCETLDGYYFGAGNAATATPCDADGDGWVREEALAVRSDTLGLGPNMRCDILQVDRVRLVDEYGIFIEVHSCDVGLVRGSAILPDGGVPNGGVGVLPDGGLRPGADGGSACPHLSPLELVETERNDTPGRPGSTDSPPYGGASGRPLAAEELNSLTKACVSPAADYNDNKLDDMLEAEGSPRTGTVPANRLRLERFSYFVELYTASVEGRTLVIRERPRCEESFPFRYAVDGGAEPWDADAGAPYWRTCSRSRDSAYDPATNEPGFDFAGYSCDPAVYPTHGCPLVPVPHPSLIAPVDPSRTLIRHHGLCELGGLRPADGLWRGFNHHSQFKCVNVVTARDANSKPDDYEVRVFSSAPGGYTFQQCVAAPREADGGYVGASAPVIRCTPRSTATAGQVGFAAVNFQPGDGGVYEYTRGCINEDSFPNPNGGRGSMLCPSPTYSLDRAALENNFGRYSCFGKGANFLWCGKPCTPSVSTMRWGPTDRGADTPTGRPVWR